MKGLRNRAKRLRQLAQLAAILVAMGITISYGARSFASTVELANRPIAREVPESAELFGMGVGLLAVAASARRAVRRRSDAG
jgi:TRAP-type C4-dicarboxylate transport system permease small subunit